MSSGEETEEYTLIDFARAGEKQPFIDLFADPTGLNQFLAAKDEYTQSTPLHMAAANGHTDLISLFLSQINDASLRQQAVNAQNDSGNTPLHWAALTGSLAAVKLLHAAGANPLLKNKAGFDACYQADCANQTEIANFLYSVADVDADVEADPEN